MISKNDCMSLLVKLEDKGIDINSMMKTLIMSKETPIEVLKFIFDNQGFEVGQFYEMLRRRYNQKKSPLYGNILKENIETEEVVLTLNCFLTQILLYAKKLDAPAQFYKDARAQEISGALNEYFINNNLSTCLALLQAIRTDIIVLEGIAGKRDFA